MKDYIKINYKILNTLRKKLSNIWGTLKSKVFKNTLYLYQSHLFILIGGILINIINTRSLGPKDYGLYTFILGIVEFINLFIDFGYYSSGARVLALHQNNEKMTKQLMGALIIITTILSIISTFILFCISFIVNPIFNIKADSLIRIFCLLFGLLGLRALVESICRGTGKIVELSVFNVGQKILHIILISIFVLTNYYSVKMAITFALITNLIAASILIVKYNPKFKELKNAFEILKNDVKRYGFKTYIGNISQTASYKTDSLMISYFVDVTAVGYYHIASLVTIPLITFSKALSTTMFKDFTHEKKLDRKVTYINITWLLVGAILLITLGKYIITIMFGSKYESVIPLIFPMTITALLGGMSKPFNMFLGAKGMGTYLRNAAFLMTAINILLNLLLIPKFQALGACYASLVSHFTNLILHLRYYNKTIRNQ